MAADIPEGNIFELAMALRAFGLVQFDVDLGIWCDCGVCEEACNFAAIKMATMYEFSTENKEDLLWDMNKLQEMGREFIHRCHLDSNDV